MKEFIGITLVVYVVFVIAMLVRRVRVSFIIELNRGIAFGVQSKTTMFSDSLLLHLVCITIHTHWNIIDEEE